MEQIIQEEIVTNPRLTRDLRNAAATMTDDEARYLVDMYYQFQHYRIATNNQMDSVDRPYKNEVKRIKESEELTDEEKQEQIAALVKEPHETLGFFFNNFAMNETDIQKALKKYVESKPIGRWLLSICGIGPVIAAGLIAHIDIKKAPTAGHIWNYAGLNPNIQWEKGQKRPFNAKLKTLCWKIGESFIKVQNREKDVYGHIFAERKALEMARNQQKMFAEQADAKLTKFKIGKTTDAYKNYVQGLLPPAHIQSRARRYAVKLFLSHLQQVWWELETGEKPPKPFAIGILGHAHMIQPPNLDVVNL